MTAPQALAARFTSLLWELRALELAQLRYVLGEYSSSHEKCDVGTNWNDTSHKCEKLSGELHALSKKAHEAGDAANKASADATSDTFAHRQSKKHRVHAGLASAHHGAAKQKAAASELHHQAAEKAKAAGFHELSKEHTRHGEFHAATGKKHTDMAKTHEEARSAASTGSLRELVREMRGQL